MPINPVTGQEITGAPEAPRRIVGRSLQSAPHAVPMLRAEISALSQALIAAGVHERVVEEIRAEARRPFE